MAPNGSSSTGLDLLLQLSLARLAVPGSVAEVPEDLGLPSLAFGDVGFFYNHFWRGIGELSGLGKGGQSHPGVCIDPVDSVLAFGTSKIRDRDPRNPHHLQVSAQECPLLRQTTLFLLKLRQPGDYLGLDISRALPMPLSAAARQELSRKLRELHEQAFPKAGRATRARESTQDGVEAAAHPTRPEVRR